MPTKEQALYKARRLTEALVIRITNYLDCESEIQVVTNLMDCTAETMVTIETFVKLCKIPLHPGHYTLYECAIYPETKYRMLDSLPVVNETNTHRENVLEALEIAQNMHHMLDSLYECAIYPETNVSATIQGILHIAALLEFNLGKCSPQYQAVSELKQSVLVNIQ